MRSWMLKFVKRLAERRKYLWSNRGRTWTGHVLEILEILLEFPVSHLDNDKSESEKVNGRFLGNWTGNTKERKGENIVSVKKRRKRISSLWKVIGLMRYLGRSKRWPWVRWWSFKKYWNLITIVITQQNDVCKIVESLNVISFLIFHRQQISEEKGERE